MGENRWCTKKNYWRPVVVCEHRARKLDIKRCQRCMNDYNQLKLPLKIKKTVGSKK